MIKLFFTLLIILNITIPTKVNRDCVDNLHDRIYKSLDNNIDSALTLTKQSIQHSKDIDYAYGEGNSLFILGYIYEQKGQPVKAMIEYLKAVLILEKQRDVRSINTHIKTLVNCGQILQSHFKYNEALEYFNQAIALAKTQDLQKRLMIALYNRSSNNHEKKDYASAIQDALASLKVAMKLGDEYMTVNNLNLLGILHMRSGHYETAREYYQGIIDYNFQKLSPSKYVGRAYHNLANSYLTAGDYTTAEKHYQKALEEKQRRNKPTELFATYHDLCQTYLELDNLESSQYMGELANDIYNKMPLKTENYNLYHLLSNVYHKLNDSKKSIEYANLYSEENTMFLDEQQQIIQEKDKFKMDLVLAGFNQEIANNNKISYLQWWICGLAGLAIAVFLMMQVFWKWKKHLVKKDFDNLDFPDLID